MSLDTSPEAVAHRLQQASRLAGSLRPEARLESKLDLGAAAIAARLRQASELLDLCRGLARAGAAATGLGRQTPGAR